MKNELPSEEIQQALKSIVEHFDKEDREVRERQIREYRRNKFYWDGYTNIFWSQINHDWRIIDTQVDADNTEIDYYDKRVNIYQAYLESIIAALSASIPGLKAYPDDAENPDDITTAKACNKIAELLIRHNNGELLWLKMLFILATEGAVYSKICKETNKKYGIHKEPIYEDYTEDQYLCPSCGASIPDELFIQPQNGMQPNLEGMEEFGMGYPGEEIGIFCPSCEAPIDPALQKMQVMLQRITGYNEEPKSRIKFDAFGGLFVKTPTYARNQEEMLYLSYKYETHFANIRAEYPHLKEKFTESYNSSGSNEPYEKWGRLSTQYLGDTPTNTLTCAHTWLRPESYHILKDEDEIKELMRQWPNGCCVTLVEDCFADVTGSQLDDEWKITKNPLSDYIQFQPSGTKMVDVQDITNELISITLQTIEHGIPQTFVDPNVLNFNQYGQTRVAPGMIYPATPKGGKSLGDAFYEVKTSTLSQEVLPFGQNIQSLGQISTGALPSLFGGADLSGSKTASEYSMSRNQALQRLQNSWKIMSNLWKDMFTLAIPAYIECVVEDEKFVTKDQNGNFINSWIRKSELEGKIGGVELEGAENLPSTWQQKKDTIMQFLQAANPVVMQAMIDPVNLPIIAQAVGLGDIELPGMDDRTKQYEEIALLIQSAPIIMPSSDPLALVEQEVTGIEAAPEELPSVEIEPDVDNHEVHMAICKSWLVSEAGRLSKIENPEGYKNVLLHMKQHLMFVQAAMMSQQQMPEKTEGKPQNDKMAAPLKNGNVNE